MFTDRIFLNTFLLSLCVHGIILSQKPNFTFISGNIKTRKIEINYLNNSRRDERLMQQAKIAEMRHKQEEMFNLSQKSSVAKTSVPPFVDKKNIFKITRESMLQDSDFVKPTLTKSDFIEIKKKITFHEVEKHKSYNPVYISYYHIVREKIKRAAYQNYTRTEMGEVFLSFVISNDGNLKDFRIVEGKSLDSPYLKALALKSVKDAAPFPKFPKDLDYSQLSFNVIVSFEVE